MWRMLALSLLSALLLSATAQAAKEKKKANAPEPAAAIDADKLAPGDFSGKLMTAPGSNGSFTLEMTYQHLELNPNYRLPAQGSHHHQLHNTLLNDQRHIAQLQQQVSRARNSQTAAHAMQQLQQAMLRMQLQMTLAQFRAQANQQQALANMFRVVNDKKTIEFHAGENMVVRNLNLPVEYNEKGVLKKFTPEEIKKLKGDKPNLIGYESKVEDLQVGQIVKVTLARKKAEAKKPEDKDKDIPGAKVEDHKTQVTMLVIVKADSDLNTLSGDKKGKKK